MKDFNINASQLTLTFKCPECGADVTENILVPEVNYEAESANGNGNASEITVTCPDCCKEFQIEIFVNIYGGTVTVKTEEGEEIDDTTVSEKFIED